MKKSILLACLTIISADLFGMQNNNFNQINSLETSLNQIPVELSTKNKRKAPENDEMEESLVKNKRIKLNEEDYFGNSTSHNDNLVIAEKNQEKAGLQKETDKFKDLYQLIQQQFNELEPNLKTPHKSIDKDQEYIKQLNKKEMYKAELNRLNSEIKYWFNVIRRSPPPLSGGG